MTFAATVLLGAIAGFTIYLGLPIARLKNLSPAWQAFLNALATGILVFLLWDILTKAAEPISTALAAADHGELATFLLLLFCLPVDLALACWAWSPSRAAGFDRLPQTCMPRKRRRRSLRS